MSYEDSIQWQRTEEQRSNVIFSDGKGYNAATGRKIYSEETNFYPLNKETKGK